MKVNHPREPHKGGKHAEKNASSNVVGNLIATLKPYLDEYGYWAVFGVTLLENLGVPMRQTILIAGALLASHGGHAHRSSFARSLGSRRDGGGDRLRHRPLWRKGFGASVWPLRIYQSEAIAIRGEFLSAVWRSRGGGGSLL